MKPKNIIFLGIFAILALVVSLPMEWITLHKASFVPDRTFGNFSNMLPNTIAMSITGLNGHITWLVKMPIWFIVVIGIAGVVISVLIGIRAILLPTWALLIPIVFSGIYMFIGLSVGLKEQASIGIGLIVALIGIGLAFVHALTCQPKEEKGT